MNRVRRKFKATSRVTAYKDQEEGYAEAPRTLPAGTCIWVADEDAETRVLNGRILEVVLCWIEGGQTWYWIPREEFVRSTEKLPDAP